MRLFYVALRSRSRFIDKNQTLISKTGTGTCKLSVRSSQIPSCHSHFVVCPPLPPTILLAVASKNDGTADGLGVPPSAIAARLQVPSESFARTFALNTARLQGLGGNPAGTRQAVAGTILVAGIGARTYYDKWIVWRHQFCRVSISGLCTSAPGANEINAVALPSRGPHLVYSEGGA